MIRSYILLLRGINVSGKNIIKMDQLKKMMIDLGFNNCRTYIQSGNVLFESNESDRLKLIDLIQNQIEIIFNLKVKLQVLLPEELEKALAENPFLKQEELDVKQHYFAFLDEVPTSDALNNLLNWELNGELMAYAPKVLFVYYSNGAGQSKLTTNFIESKLKVGATMRNLNTTQKLISLANS